MKIFLFSFVITSVSFSSIIKNSFESKLLPPSKGTLLNRFKIFAKKINNLIL